MTQLDWKVERRAREAKDLTRMIPLIIRAVKLVRFVWENYHVADVELIPHVTQEVLAIKDAADQISDSKD